MRISVVVLAFNEEEQLDQVVREIQSVLVEIGETFEVIILDDGSSDGTAAIADSLDGELAGVRTIRHPENLGLGEAYRTGFREVRGEIVTFLPGDRQFSADIIPLFLPHMETSDLVMSCVTEQNRSVFARALSFAERVLYRLLFGPFPRFQGVIMFRRKLLEELELKSTGRGWAILMELIVRATRGGYRSVSVVAEMHPRTSGKSKVVNLRTIWSNLAQTFALLRHL